MCTMIVKQAEMAGSGKIASGWFKLQQANVSFDHPFDAPFEHALNIDFVDESQGLGKRLSVELSAESARRLIDTIQAVLDQAVLNGFVGQNPD